MDFNTLLGQMETSRPDLANSFALIRQYQKAKEDNQSNENIIISENDRSVQLEHLLDKQRKLNNNLFQHYQQLETNYRQLVTHLDEMAEAIGACPHCWGEDNICSYCRGKGKPGYFQPNISYFEIYIKPLMGKLKEINSNH